MKHSRNINAFVVVLSLCMFVTGYAQQDTIPSKHHSTTDPSRPSVFSSKSSATVISSDTLPDGTILENIPPPRKPRNAIFAEIFTNGGLYSLNYDRILFLRERIGTTLRAGVFFYPESMGTYQSSLVLEPNILIGNEKIYFETGVGFTRFIIVEKQAEPEEKAYKRIDWENYVSVRAGFRMQSKKESGLFFRAGLTPVIYYMDSEGSGWYGQLLGGLGFGVSF